MVDNVRADLPKMQDVLDAVSPTPGDIQASFEFDQSPYVTNSIRGIAFESALATLLVGLMVLVFLRDWRSVLVVLNFPLALTGSVVALALTGQTINSEKSEVKLSIPAYSSASLSGAVARTSWALEAGSRTLRTEIDLPNPEGWLRPGMFVDAQIINPLSVNWTLPASAVVKQGDSTVVFLIEGGKSVRVPVLLGRSDGQFVEVLQRQNPGAPGTWADFTGNQEIAVRANGLTDGQAVVSNRSGK